MFAGEDFAAPTPGGARREIEILVHVADIAECQQLLVTLNGVTLRTLEYWRLGRTAWMCVL